jgi:hypothetical protein
MKEFPKIINSNNEYSLTIKGNDKMSIKSGIYKYSVLMKDCFNIIVSENDVIDGKLMISINRVN